MDEKEEGPLDADILNFPLATEHLYPPEPEDAITHDAEENSIELAGM